MVTFTRTCAYRITVDWEIFVVKIFSWSSQNLIREINSTTHPQYEQKHGEFSTRKSMVFKEAG